MTFYAHTPASLAAPVNTSLNRPSKLNPAERLWRPTPNTPPKTSPSSTPSHSPGPSGFSRPGGTASPKSNYLSPAAAASPPRSRTSSSVASASLPRREYYPSSHQESAPSAIPSTLPPVAGLRRQPQSIPSSPPTRSSQHQDYFTVPISGELTAIPTSLIPGRGAHRSSPSPPESYTFPSRQSASLPSTAPIQQIPQPRFSSSPSTPPSYTPYAYSPTPAPAFQPSPLTPDVFRLREPPATISFPVPQPSAAPTYVYGPNLAAATASIAAPAYDGRRGTNIQYPYLQTRYTTPLPLPDSPPRGRQPLGPEVESRRKALLQAEEEAAKRKQQEDQDLELARQLDRELNLGV
jgi:hypothetical protein